MKQILKIFLFILFITVIHSHLQENINEEQLEEIKRQKKVWLIYGYKGPSDDNIQILNDVSQALYPFFKVGIVGDGDGVLRLYQDDGNIQQYRGQFSVNDIVDFTLQETEEIIKDRSKIASEVKANKQFAERQAERATKQWNDEQQLRKKSDVFILNEDTWESSFLKERGPYFINFYEANCSACIQLNQEWEVVATSLKGKARIAKLNITQAVKLQQSNQLVNFPTIRFYSVGTKKPNQYSEFDGVKKKFSIIEWANIKLSEKKQTIQLQQLNKDSYKTLCKESKSTCILIFADDPSSVSDKVSELAAKHLKKPIVFLISQYGTEAQFEKQLGVESGSDTVFIYCKQKKMLRLGNIDFGAIEETINEISNGNRNNFVKYNFVEQLI